MACLLAHYQLASGAAKALTCAQIAPAKNVIVRPKAAGWPQRLLTRPVSRPPFIGPYVRQTATDGRHPSLLCAFALGDARVRLAGSAEWAALGLPVPGGPRNTTLSRPVMMSRVAKWATVTPVNGQR